MNTRYIYGLFDKETRACFYVGQTKDKRRRRYTHRSLYKARPHTFRVLTKTESAARGPKLERAWIARMTERGFTLDNANHLDPITGALRYEIIGIKTKFATEGDLSAKLGCSIQTLRRYAAYQDADGLFEMSDARNGFKTVKVVDHAKAPIEKLRLRPKPFAGFFGVPA